MREEYDRFVGSLPAAAGEWEAACALYARESVADSLVGDAAVNQLRGALELLAANAAVPPWDNVYFENESGTELAARADFQTVLERAMAGEIKVIGAYLSSRLFRNADEASAVKKQLRRRGVKLLWLGKPVGLDERDPSGWLMERNADVLDEWHSRQTGWLVGRQLEYKTRKGEPIGHLPECWRIVERAPALRPGHVGRPIRWELVEPIASIVREGAARYLAGDSWNDVAAWSQTTELRGVTPAGRSMDWVWWNQLLKNPKLAGRHYVSLYPGYKAGKESPTRKELDLPQQLVPCLLPPVISVDDWEAVVERSQSRHHGSGGPGRRHADRPAEILAGIAYDARCSHQLHITKHEKGDYFVRCAQRVAPRHGSIFGAGAAGEDLDKLVGRIVLDDRLVEEIIRALQAKADAAPAAPPLPVPPPAVMKLRSAIVSMKGDRDLDETRHQLEAKLRLLEQEAAAVRRPKGLRAGRFHEAIAALRRWSEVWADATTAEKNRVLRAAGVRAYVEPTRSFKGFGKKAHLIGRRSRLVRIEAQVPEFALALAVALGNEVDCFDQGPHGSKQSTWSGRVEIQVDREYLPFVSADGLQEAA